MNPAVCYLIASIQRSGTHLLCSILRSTGVAGAPAEYFLCRHGETWEERWGAPSRADYVERVFQQNTTDVGVFGAVIMWSYLERMLQMLQEIPGHENLTGSELLAAVFNGPKYVWMRRRNRVEQAVSWAIACQTRVWAQKVGNKPRPRGIPKFDYKVIDEWCNRIAAHDAGWENYFRENHIEPLVLFYEDVVASHNTAAKRVLEFLDLPFPRGMKIPAAPIEKQADQTSEEWIAAYLKLKRKKAGRFASMIRRFRW
jgi:LPS sulfotransferase NodH